MENTVTIPRDRYDNLLRAEARIQFLTAYCKHEVFTAADIEYYLGIKEDAHEEDSEPSAE